MQSDGKIVVGGQLGPSNSANSGVVLRLNPNGSFDNSFGTNGVVTIKFGAIDNRLAAMALQTSDGAGNLVVARYLGN